MENADEHLFTVGELAKLVGVSVRTLQFYDQKNLLNSTYNDSHKRMYTRDDLYKVLQILFLKSLGMPLQEISNKLLKSNDSVDFKEILLQQREILLNRIASLNKIINTLDLTVSDIMTGQEIGLDRLIAISEFIKQGRPVYEKLHELYEKGADPAGKEGQALAKQWWSVVGELSGGDVSMLRSLTSAMQDIKSWPDKAVYQNESAEKFLEEALRTYFHNNDIPI